MEKGAERAGVSPKTTQLGSGLWSSMLADARRPGCWEKAGVGGAHPREGSSLGAQCGRAPLREPRCGPAGTPGCV